MCAGSWLEASDTICGCGRRLHDVCVTEAAVLMADRMNMDQIMRYNRRQEAERDRKRAEHGRVYFAQRDNGLIKIGVSINVESRIRELSKQVGDLELVATVPGYHAEERKYHDRFAAHRQHGEWFDITPDQVKEAINGASDSLR